MSKEEEILCINASITHLVPTVVIGAHIDNSESNNIN